MGPLFRTSTEFCFEKYRILESKDEGRAERREKSERGIKMIFCINAAQTFRT